MATNPAFVDFLYEQMRAHDFESVRQFAVWIGLSNSIVASVMNGTRDPGLDFMIAVANATGVNLADLVELARPGSLPRTELSLDARKRKPPPVSRRRANRAIRRFKARSCARVGIAARCAGKRR